MKWWKTALVASLIWTPLIAIGILLMIQHTNKATGSPAPAEAREDKLGETSGPLFGGGQVAIWAVAWGRERRQLK